jgi:hypothetical protein
MNATFESLIRSLICQGKRPPKSKADLYLIAATAIGVGPHIPKGSILGRLLIGVADAVARESLVKAGGYYRVKHLGSGTNEAPEPRRKDVSSSPTTPADEALGGPIERSRRS